MDQNRLKLCLSHFGLSADESKSTTYLFGKEYQISLVLQGGQATWSVDRLSELSLEDDFVVCTQVDRQVYYLSYEHIVGLKLKHAPQTKPAGFGRS